MGEKTVFEGKANGAFFAILCCLLWGSSYPAMKLSYAALSINNSFDAIQVAGVRYAFSGLLVLAYSRMKEKTSLRPPKNEVGIITVLTVLSLVTYTAYYIGITFVEASKSSILSSAEIFITVFLSHFAFKDDKINLRKIIGLIFGVIGILAINLLNGNSFTISFTPEGEGLLLFTSLLLSISSLFIKKKSNEFNILRVNGYQMLLSGFALGIIGLSAGTKTLCYNWEGVGYLIYLTVNSAVAVSLWYAILKYHKTGEISIYKFVMPVFGTILSVFIMPGERLTWGMGIGLIFATAGIAVTYLPVRKNVLNLKSEKNKSYIDKI